MCTAKGADGEEKENRGGGRRRRAEEICRRLLQLTNEPLKNIEGRSMGEECLYQPMDAS